MDNGNEFIQGRTCNKFEMEKKEYIDVVFAKHPSMIKLEWNLVEVYCKRIQLRSSFRGENCVYLLVLFLFAFIGILSLVSNRSLHSFSFVTINTLQTDALICVTSSFLLLRLLLFDINACHKCVTYLGFIHYWMTKPLFFGLISCPLIPILIFVTG